MKPILKAPILKAIGLSSISIFVACSILFTVMVSAAYAKGASSNRGLHISNTSNNGSHASPHVKSITQHVTHSHPPKLHLIKQGKV